MTKTLPQEETIAGMSSTNRYRFINDIDPVTGKPRHLHTLDGKPLIGTSNVPNVVQKPLHWWALQVGLAELGYIPYQKRVEGKYVPIPMEERLAKAAEALTKIRDLIPADYLALLDKAYRAHDSHKNKSATKGTDMHAELEKYVKRCIADFGGIPQLLDSYEHAAVEIFAKWSSVSVARFLWSELHCYSEEFWLGGITDCGIEDKFGRYGIIDFKSSKEAYMSQFWQDAGYDIQLAENGGYDAEGNKVFELDKPISFYGVFPFGMPEPKISLDEDVEEARAAFLSCLTIYKKLNNNL